MLPAKTIGRHKALSSRWGEPPGPLSQRTSRSPTLLWTVLVKGSISSWFYPGELKTEKLPGETPSTMQKDKDTYGAVTRDLWRVDREPGYCDILCPSPCSCSFCFFFSSLRSLTLRSLALPMLLAWQMDSSRVARPLEGSTTSLGAPWTDAVRRRVKVAQHHRTRKCWVLPQEPDKPRGSPAAEAAASGTTQNGPGFLQTMS